MNRILSDEEIEADIAQRYKNLNIVEHNIVERFKSTCPIELIELGTSDSHQFRALVIFDTNRQLEESKKNGNTEKIIDAVYEELERAGRGKRGEIKVNGEFNTCEYIDEKLEGQIGPLL